MSLIFVVIAGAFSGFLINYLSDVLPVSRRLSQPSCKKCGHTLSATNYMTFKRCPDCDNKRSNRSFVVLISTITFSMLLHYFPFSRLTFWATIPILIFLGTILVIDHEHRVVLIQTSLFGFALFFLYGLIVHGLSTTLLGGLGGLLILVVFYYLGIIFSKIIAKVKHQEMNEVAFGFGDVCLGFILGLLTGWPGILGAIIISMLAFVAFSIVYLIALIILKRYHAFSNTLPFTFFLVLGGILIFYL